MENQAMIRIEGSDVEGFFVRVELPTEFVTRFREDHNIVILSEVVTYDWGRPVADAPEVRFSTAWFASLDDARGEASNARDAIHRAIKLCVNILEETFIQLPERGLP